MWVTKITPNGAQEYLSYVNVYLVNDKCKSKSFRYIISCIAFIHVFRFFWKTTKIRANLKFNFWVTELWARPLAQRTDAGTDRSSVTEPSVLIKLKELFKYNLNAPMNLPQVRNQTVWSRQQDHENEPCGKSHKKWSRSFESEDTSEQMLLLYFLLSNGVFSLTINDAKSLSTPDENCP